VFRRVSIALIAAPFIATLILILLTQKGLKMLEQGIKNFKWTPEADAFIAKALIHGKKFSWIAAKLGCTRNAVIGRYNRTKRGRND